MELSSKEVNSLLFKDKDLIDAPFKTLGTDVNFKKERSLGQRMKEKLGYCETKQTMSLKIR